MWYDGCVLGGLFCFVFPEIWLFFFFLTPLERVRVSFKSFNSGFLKNLSVWHVCHFSQSSNESWQFSHNGICWQVVRAESEYVWKTVRLVEKESKRKPPSIWNIMFNFPCSLKSRVLTLSQIQAQQRQPRREGSLKINVSLSLQRSGGTLPLCSIYLHKIELPLMFNNRWWEREEPLPVQSEEGQVFNWASGTAQGVGREP